MSTPGERHSLPIVERGGGNPADTRPPVEAGLRDVDDADLHGLLVAFYDTVAEAVPLAISGTRRKKALVIISDGNDTSSRTKADQLSGLVRRTEVIVYAIAIDASGDLHQSSRPSGPPQPVPVPSPFPGKAPLPQAPRPQRPAHSGSPQDRVNPEALRRITDDTGGRTEVVVSPRDLDPATASIAKIAMPTPRAREIMRWGTPLPEGMD